MGNFFKDMLKISIDIPYENYQVYPTVTVTNKAVSEYRDHEKIDCEFLGDEDNDNIQVKLGGKCYKVVRFNGGRGGYGIKCTPI